MALARPVAPRLLIAVVAGAGAAASGVGLMAASAWLISRAAQHPPVLHLMVAIVAVRAFGLGRGALRYVERLAGHDAALRLLGDVRAMGYAGLERMAPVGLRGARAGDLVTRFVSDVDTTVDLITRVVLPYAVAAVVGAASVALLWTLLPAAALLLLAGLLATAVGVPLVQAAVTRKADRRTAPLRGELAAQVVELVHGAPDLLAYGAAAGRLARTADTDRDLRRTASRVSASIGLGSALVALAAGACVWGALALGTPAVRSGTLDGVLLTVVVLTPLAVFEAIAALPTAAAALGQGRASLRRVFTIVDRPTAVASPASPTALPAAPYHVRVEGVTARWAPDAPIAVSNVDLDLTPGRRVALVGPSGCGKSTVAALLVRFLDPVRGRITLNGVDLRRLAPEDVRRVIGLVAEDAHVFDTTIEENLRIGKPSATVADLRDALAAARLLEFVDGLPAGLATPVGERGEHLSGGQRRRLVLARALLADFPVLLLDEPAEHLDEETAASVTADLLDATTGRTVVLISHRPYDVDAVDETIRLDVPARDLGAAPHRAAGGAP